MGGEYRNQSGPVNDADVHRPDRADEARERAELARQRSAEIADRLTELRQGDASTAETAERAQRAAGRSTELAIEGYVHAAEGMERAAEAHE